MKILRISLLLLLVAAVVVSGCKVAQQTAPASETVPSEQVVDSGLQELNEIDTLTEENDLGLDELENMDLK